MMSSQRIAIFASGKGSNAESIINYFENNDSIEVGLIISNNSKAGVLNLAERKGIDSKVIDKDFFYKSEKIVQLLNYYKIDYIILAGFLWLLPSYLISEFENHILNIHPALLPKYGGKGMFGQHVHRAVYDNNEEESGITIHLVNENYDEGKILFQDSCAIEEEDTPDDIGEKVLRLEHFHYPRIIEDFINGHQ